MFSLHIHKQDPSPSRHVWLNRDPLGEEGGISLYGFVGNDPIMGVDAFGLYEEDVHKNLTSRLGKRAGFPKEIATTIADADQGVDDSAITGPFVSKKAREDFHFTTPQRRKQMRDDAFRNKDPVQFGKYLHAFQDSFSHQTGKTDRNGEPYGPKFGHVWSHDPDKTNLRPGLAMKMAEGTYNELRSFYIALYGTEPPNDWNAIKNSVDESLRIPR